MTDPILRIIVRGTPGTAGSKSAFPIYAGSGPDRRFMKTVVVEKPSETKKNWRAAMESAALQAMGNVDPVTYLLFPLDEPLIAEIVFTVPKPTSAPKRARSWPSARPDLLKYTRATEDHLTAVGILKDDARIVEYRRLAKVYPGEDPAALPAPGAVILLWRARDLIDIAAPAVAGEPATLFGGGGS